MSSNDTMVNYISAAIRAYIVNQMTNEDDLQDLTYVFIELGYTNDEVENQPDKIRPFIKEELSKLACQQTLDSKLLLVKLIENIIQFYLISSPDGSEKLQKLNNFLPPGLQFSPQSGHLLFSKEKFIHEQNLLLESFESGTIQQIPQNAASIQKEVPAFKTIDFESVRPPEPVVEVQEAPPEPVVEVQEAPPEPVVEVQEAPPEPVVEVQEAPPEPVVEVHEAPPEPVVEVQEAPPEPVVEVQEAPPEPVVEFQEAPPEPVVELRQEVPFEPAPVIEPEISNNSDSSSEESIEIEDTPPIESIIEEIESTEVPSPVSSASEEESSDESLVISDENASITEALDALNEVKNRRLKLLKKLQSGLNV